MTTSSPADAGAPASAPLDDVVDRGSWQAFGPSLARYLEEVPVGTTILLTAPAPVVTEESVATRGGLRSWLRRGPRRVPSPEVPGLVLLRRGDGVEVDAPVLDAAGRVLLSEDACDEMGLLGWSREEDLLRRLVPEAGAAADAATRALIEILRVAHPADLDHLVTTAG